MSILCRNLLRLLVIFMILGMLFVGLYPFNFFPKNRVSVNEDGPGVHFFGRGIAYREEVVDWSLKDPVTLEVALVPERIYTYRVPHILALCDKSGLEVMYLGQWEDSLILRLVEDNRWVEKLIKEIDAGTLLHPGEPVHIIIVLNQGSADIYANGQLVRKFDDFDFTAAVSKRPVHTIVLGNASTGDSSWRGKILEFAVLDGVMDPTEIRNRYEQWETNPSQDIQNIDITVPENLTPIRREFLTLPSGEYLQERSFYKDVIINVAGFIPLGLALAILFFTENPSKKYTVLNLIFPVLIGGLLSLLIETGQTFLFTRSSSITDLALNILGSGIGMVIYWGGQGIIPNFKLRVPNA